MANEYTQCPRCGTEYPHGVSAEDGSCDWCPDVQPVTVERRDELEACSACGPITNGRHKNLMCRFARSLEGLA